MAVAAAVVRAVIAAAHVGRSPYRDSHIRSRCCGISIRSVGVQIRKCRSNFFLLQPDSRYGYTHETNVVCGKS